MLNGILKATARFQQAHTFVGFHFVNKEAPVAFTFNDVTNAEAVRDVIEDGEVAL